MGADLESLAKKGYMKHSREIRTKAQVITTKLDKIVIVSVGCFF